MNKKYKVLVTRKLPSNTEARLKELFECKLNPDDKAYTTYELQSCIKDYHGIVSTITDNIDKNVIKAGINLKIISNFGVGIEHIDLVSAKNNNVIVTNTPDSLTDDTADMAMAMILAVSRRVVEGTEMLKNNKWEGWSPTWMCGHRIYGKRLGIIGMGRIGQALAKRARGFGMPIHYNNRNRLPSDIESSLEASFWPSIDEMIPHVDIVSLNCPYTKSTHHLINKKRLELMKSYSFLINTSRGDVVDEDALIKALQENQIAGVALDVFSNEPNVPKALKALPNAICLPHMASATLESRYEMGEQVIINLKAVFDGHSPPNRVIIEN